MCLISNFSYFYTFVLKFCHKQFFLGARFEIAKTINFTLHIVLETPFLFLLLGCFM